MQIPLKNISNFPANAHLTLDQHNVLDYVHGATVAFSPYLFGFHRVLKARQACYALGLGTITYSLMTDYRYSAAKVIPLGVHMSLDIFSGVALAACPWIFGYKDRLSKKQRIAHLILGMGALAVVAFTRPRTQKERLKYWAKQLDDKLRAAA